MDESRIKELDILQGYLLEASEFLAEHAWIYNIKNVDIFISDVLENIPSEWKEALLHLPLDDIRKIPFNYFQENWPISLKTFLKNVWRLAGYRYEQPQFAKSVDHIKIPDFIKKNTPSKKVNEILWMAAAVENALQKHGCSIVLDIGSGLGYLDQILHYNFGVITVGFESVEDRSLKATQRLQQGCSQNMHYVNATIQDNEESIELIRTKVNEVSSQKMECSCGIFKQYRANKTDKIMVIGLHSCGNLMQNMMKLFLKIPEIEVFLTVGCCYHLIPVNTEFPLSNVLKKALLKTEDKHPRWAPSTTGLRLGCQYTREYWKTLSNKQHQQQEMCLFYRAVLQQYTSQESLKWSKPRRHMRKDVDVSSFENFISFAFQNCSWPEMDTKIRGLRQLCEEKEKLVPCIRLLNLFQTLLQPIWEGLILADRLAYFLENNISAETFLLCDELLSPRNIILFGIK